MFGLYQAPFPIVEGIFMITCKWEWGKLYDIQHSYKLLWFLSGVYGACVFLIDLWD